MILALKGCDHRAYPSTTFGGPPPRAGEDYPNAACAAANRAIGTRYGLALT